VALTPEQVEKVRAAAEEAGVDPERLLAVAQREHGAPEKDKSGPNGTEGKPGGAGGAAPKERQQLYQYHLPFVTVREVRDYLRSGGIVLDDAFAGDPRVAAAWAAETAGKAEPAPNAGGGPGAAGGEDKTAELRAKVSRRTFVAKAPAARYEFAGLPIAVENPRGSTRTWVDEDGNTTGSTLMHHDYGFIEGHVGTDGDELDVYVGPNEGATHVYVVHQLRAPAFEKHDEDKVMLGFPGEREARAAYAAHRNDGETAIGAITGMTLERFKGKLERRSGRGKISA